MIDTSNTERRTVPIIARPHLISNKRVDFEMPEGTTIGQILDASGIDIRFACWTRVEIDGREIPALWWDRVKPKGGRLVSISIVPGNTGGGGGGGEDSNKALRTVLLVVVAIAAIVTSYLTYGAVTPAWAPVVAGLAGAVVSIGGSSRISALVPPA